MRTMLIAVLLTCGALCAALPARAQSTLVELHPFHGADGAEPYSVLLPVSGGAFVGTTYEGGAANRGTVFKLSPPSGNGTTWTLSILHQFNGAADGSNPMAGLLNHGGALYGTTSTGSHLEVPGVSPASPGVVYELSKTSSGTMKETILHTFTASGGSPYGQLIADSEGRLYGTTYSADGQVFRLTPPTSSGGNWSYEALYTFNSTTGDYPEGRLLQDSSGALYGTTSKGGAHGYGTAFKLTPPASGTTWTLTTLWSFGQSTDIAQNPAGSLVMDSAGQLYGTTPRTVFRLTPPKSAGGLWSETILCDFYALYITGVNQDLILSGTGALYGTAAVHHDALTPNGIVFKLTPPPSGSTTWGETTLYAFTGGADGATPLGGLFKDSKGNLYGTTSQAGHNGDSLVNPNGAATIGGYGSIFELTP